MTPNMPASFFVCLVLGFFLLVFFHCPLIHFKVITCLASSAIKRQVHSYLINARACTAAVSAHEGWNILTETLQNKHTSVVP